MVVFYLLMPQRLKRSQPHMQRQLRRFNASRCDAIQNFAREVQSRGRRRHRTQFAGKHRLVLLAVLMVRRRDRCRVAAERAQCD